METPVSQSLFNKAAVKAAAFKKTFFPEYLQVTASESSESVLLLYCIRAAVVECMRKYMDGISQNLQSLSSY